MNFNILSWENLFLLDVSQEMATLLKMRILIILQVDFLDEISEGRFSHDKDFTFECVKD